jgi:hypothetical protein
MPRIMKTALVLIAAAFATTSVHAAGSATLTRPVLFDKIRGGWAGQMIGVAYGAPTEFKSNGKIGEWNLVWKPGMLENTIHQDDLYVEMTFAKVMDSVGLDATCEQYGEAFKTSQYNLWHANAGARRVLNQGIKAPWSGHPKYNFHANDIDFQIEADFIGLMCPGLPRESNKYCDRVGRVMNYGDGLYGGMFTCGMYAAAFFETDPHQAVQAGLACIPPKSEYAQLINDLLQWHAQHPQDWRQVWQRVQDKWDKNDPCPDGALDPFNIDAKLNGAYIAFGLLFGDGDFEKTMEISTRCGQDSDCNPSSAAGVLGVILGYERIPAKFKAEMPLLENKKFSYTDYSFNEIVKSTEARALKIIQQTGGAVTEASVTVKRQTPRAPKLEQWSPGIADKKLKATDPAFAFTGKWETDKDTKTSRAAGNEVTLAFNGRAVVLTGSLKQDGGQAEVYLDGKKSGIADAYIVERTEDVVLFNVYGLKPGPHTLRLVTTDMADPRSKGRRLTINGAVVYR